MGAYLSDKALDIDELLHTLGLYEHRHKLPNQLSGGQQQRTAIGRAIVKIRTFFSATSLQVHWLQHIQGNSASDRAGQPEVRKYHHHGYPQRCH